MQFCKNTRKRRAQQELKLQVGSLRRGPTAYWPSIFQYKVYVLLVST